MRLIQAWGNECQPSCCFTWELQCLIEPLVVRDLLCCYAVLVLPAQHAEQAGPGSDLVQWLGLTLLPML